MMPSFHSKVDVFDFDKFFNDLSFRLPTWEGKRLSKVPATNIREYDKEFVLEVAAPGLTKKDFTVDIQDNMLEIKAEKKTEKTDQDEMYTRKEYDYNAFYRSFTLPEHVLSDKIKAEYKDGILRLHLPKSEQAKKKPVKEINVE